MATFKFTVLPGDGIGPEVMNAALKVLETACAKEGHSLSYTTCEVGGAAIDKFQTALPESTLEAAKPQTQSCRLGRRAKMGKTSAKGTARTRCLATIAQSF